MSHQRQTREQKLKNLGYRNYLISNFFASFKDIFASEKVVLGILLSFFSFFAKLGLPVLGRKVKFFLKLYFNPNARNFYELRCIIWSFSGPILFPYEALYVHDRLRLYVCNACYTIAEEISTTIRGVAQYEIMIAQNYMEEMSIFYSIPNYH
jgi:hypothetical protein